MTRYTTIEEIAKHAKKHPRTVRVALKHANIEGEKVRGIKGRRFQVPTINKWLTRQWTDVPLMAASVCPPTEGDN